MLTPSSISHQIPDIDWDQTTILNNGMLFLHKKNKELEEYQNLWINAQKKDDCCISLKIAGKQIKEVIQKSIKEIETLEKAATQFLAVEIAKDPLSTNTRQLSQVVLTSCYGLNYFKGCYDKVCYIPTVLNNLNKITTEWRDFYANIWYFSGLGCAASEVIQNQWLIGNFRLSFAISTVAVVGLSAISCLTHNSSNESMNAKMRKLFEGALSIPA